MPEYRAFTVGPDGHLRWSATMTQKPSGGLNGSLTVTTWSFGTALV
jgi:hypothetical protein